MTLDEALKALEGAVNTLEAANALLLSERGYYREALAVVKSFIEAVYVPAPTEPQGPPCGMDNGHSFSWAIEQLAAKKRVRRSCSSVTYGLTRRGYIECDGSIMSHWEMEHFQATDWELAE